MTDILLLGQYGSGKTTQAHALAKTWGYLHFDAGASLRAVLAQGGPRADELRAIMDKGDLVPPHITVDFLRETYERNPGLHVVIDGTPREEIQLRLFLDLLRDLKREVLPIVLTLSDEESLKRQVERRICADCATGLHADDTACPQCGSEKFTTRPDKDPEIARHRIALYHKESGPVIEHFRSLGLHEVQGEQTVARVTQDLLDVVRHEHPSPVNGMA